MIQFALYFMAVLYFLTGLATIAQIGKPRKPITHANAVASMVLALALTGVMLVAAGSLSSVSASPIQREVTIRVERSFAIYGGCPEDQVLRGRGDYSNGMYQRYGCWNPGW